MPLVATKGAASAQGFGEFAVTSTPTYIEDVFSCFLYTGNGSTQTITNGIDLSGKGGMLWTKRRSTTQNHALLDTGSMYYAASNTTDAALDGSGVWSINSTGFGMVGYNVTNANNETYVSWTFRKQPKFFDVVTWTGNGTSQNISHNLGSVPGCIIVKQTSNPSNWMVYHTSLANTEALFLNLTNAKATGSSAWNSTTPTSTVFSVGANNNVNASGESYVAYLFAHDAGGFGLTGSDNVISCGSFTTDGSGLATVNLGYEPQWVLYRRTDTGSWLIADIMRGNTANISSNTNYLLANTSGAEANASWLYPTATGFTGNASGNTNITYIYIAIRRGPMKVPTSGTSVFSPNATTGSTGTAITTNFPVDLYVWQNRDGTYSNVWQDRLRGIPDTDTNGVTLTSQSTLAEQSGGYNGAYQPWNTGLRINSGASGANSIYWNFRRAPSFFDEVCYTGAGNGTVVSHNLGVEPELFIVKKRSGAADWVARAPGTGADRYLLPNKTNAQANASGWYSATASQITFATAYGTTAGSGDTYVGYLFATCAGVSKVGSYTGNAGYTVTVPCGFTGGVRFVLIKRTDSTGDWWVYDSARGIVSGNDPYLYLNSTAAEVGGTDYIDSYSAGFEVTSTAPAGLNATGGTYIFLAIA